MKKILVYLNDYKKESIAAPLFKMLEAVFELYIPLLMAAVIDIGIRKSDREYIVKMMLIMILLGIVGLACSIIAQYFSAKAAVGFSTKLKAKLFAHIQNLSYAELDQLGSATLITRLTSDVNQLQNGVNLVLRLFLRSPFIVFGAMIMAFTIDVQGALIFCISIPLLSVVVFGIMLFSIPLYRKVQQALDRILKATRENLTGVKVIRAFRKEQKEKEIFEYYNKELTNIQIFAGKVTAIMNPGTYIIVNTALIFLIYVGALRVDAGMITQGQLVALVNYMSQILIELVKLANLIITVTKAAACGKRVSELFEQKSSLTMPEQSSAASDLEDAHILVFSDVSFTYQGAAAPALSNISIKVKKGEIIGVIGGTGSGKSTLVNLIPRFYDCTKGQIRILGKDVREHNLRELRQKIAIVPQKAVLFKGDIRSNLFWGNENASEEELLESIDIAQAGDIIKSKEAGFCERVERGGKNYSGGQRQRLTIARALLKHPEILILDDSASALDFATDAALRKGLKSLAYSPTIFIVSQRTSSIQYADQIMVLEAGRLVGVGTHDQLVGNCSLYQEIYHSQYKAEEN